MNKPMNKPMISSGSIFETVARYSRAVLDARRKIEIEVTPRKTA